MVGQRMMNMNLTFLGMAMIGVMGYHHRSMLSTAAEEYFMVEKYRTAVI